MCGIKSLLEKPSLGLPAARDSCVKKDLVSGGFCTVGDRCAAKTTRALLLSKGQFDCQGQEEHYLTSMN